MPAYVSVVEWPAVRAQLLAKEIGMSRFVLGRAASTCGARPVRHDGQVVGGVDGRWPDELIAWCALCRGCPTLASVRRVGEGLEAIEEHWAREHQR